MTEHVVKLSQSRRQESAYILYMMAFLISHFAEILISFHKFYSSEKLLGRNQEN